MLQFSNWDQFGHPIGLNFDKKGMISKTHWGGIVTLAIRFYVGIQVAFLIKSVVLRENDTNSTKSKLIQADTLGAVRMNETGFRPFVMI